MIFYLTLMLLSFSQLVLFVFPLIDWKKFTVPIACLFFAYLFMFIVLLCEDPGYIKKSDKISFLKLNQYFH